MTKKAAEAWPFPTSFMKDEAESKYPPHVQRMIAEHAWLAPKCRALESFIGGNALYGTLAPEEQSDQARQLQGMQLHEEALVARLARAGYKVDGECL